MYRYIPYSLNANDSCLCLYLQLAAIILAHYQHAIPLPSHCLTIIMLAHRHAVLGLIIMTFYYHVDGGRLSCQWLSIDHVFKMYLEIKVEYIFRQACWTSQSGLLYVHYYNIYHHIGYNTQHIHLRYTQAIQQMGHTHYHLKLNCALLAYVFNVNKLSNFNQFHWIRLSFVNKLIYKNNAELRRLAK